jgi:hypothetical protein
MSMSDTPINTVEATPSLTLTHDNLTDAGKAFVKNLEPSVGVQNIDITVRIRGKVSKFNDYEAQVWQTAKPEDLLRLAVARSGVVASTLEAIAAEGHAAYTEAVNLLKTRAARCEGRAGKAFIAAAEAAKAKNPSDRTPEEQEAVECLKAHGQILAVDAVMDAMRQQTRQTKSGPTTFDGINVDLIG